MSTQGVTNNIPAGFVPVKKPATFEQISANTDKYRIPYITASRNEEIHEVRIAAGDIQLPPGSSPADVKKYILEKLHINDGHENWDIVLSGDSYILKRRSSKQADPSQKPQTADFFHTNMRDSWGRATFDIFTHHNQFLDVSEKARSAGVLKPGGTLLHFDTHSDMKADPGSNENIADYVNRAIINGTFSEVYWILPDWTRESGSYETFWNNEHDSNIYLDGKKDHTLYVQNNKIFYEKPKDYDRNPKSYRIVKFHKVTIDELPSFKGKRNVSIDVDFDYFSNTGFDTAGEGEKSNFNPSEEELRDGLALFMMKMGQKELAPCVVTLSRSPNYTADEDIPVIEGFFSDFVFNGRQEYIADTVDAYSHNNGYSMDRAVLVRIYNTVQTDPNLRMPEPGYINEIAVRNNEQFFASLANNPREMLRLRGFNDVMKVYDAYVSDPTEHNRQALLKEIQSTLDKLTSRLYT